MSNNDLMNLLQGPEPVVADGSFSTSLYDKGFYINRSFEELCVTEAQAVREVAQEFVRAGSRIVHTNTYSSIRPKLVKYGLQDQIAEIISSAVKIGLEVAGEEALLVGCIGPMGTPLEPIGPTSIEEAEAIFKEVIQEFDVEGVKGLSFVGFHDLNELEVAVKAAKAVTTLPLLTHLGIQENMKTSYGHSINEFVEKMEKLNVAGLGFSGEVGPSGMLTALQKMKPLTEKPISLLPNAGLPRYVNDQYIYLCNPDYLGKYAKRYVQSGAKVVGGFSGVKEDHIKAICNALRMTASTASATVEVEYNIPSSISAVVDEPKPCVAPAMRSKLGEALANGDKVVSVEIVPPKGIDCSSFFDHCRALQDGGVQFVNIPDGARAVAKMSSLQLASYVSKNFNLEPIPHFTTRDRNLIGLQSDLLGCHVNGVRNILAVTGDPPKLGNCPGATAVYDVDAIGLTHILSRMNQGLDIGGSSFGKPSEFLLGVALNPTASNKELEIKRFKYKIEAGADFAITQPIYSIQTYKEFFEEMGDVDIPIIMGIWPLVSLRNAEFLKNEVPGVDVPDWVLEEMKKAKGDKEAAIKIGVDIAIETMNEAKKLVAGFQVSAPFNRVQVALDAIHSLS